MASKVVEVILRGQDAISGVLTNVRKNLSGFASAASGIAAGIGAAFGAISLGRFFASSVSEAANAERAYAAVGAALRNVGVDAKAARPEVDALVQRLSTVSGVDDEKIKDGFARLVTATGDYRTALNLLPVALDVSAARQVDLATAVDLTAKAANGNTTALSRMGVEVAKGADAVQVLRDRFGGFAEQEGQTLAGTLGRISVAWGNMKEELGRAIVGGDGFTQTGNRIVQALVNLEDWIRRNEGSISAFATGALNAAAAVGAWIGKLIQLNAMTFRPDLLTSQPEIDRAQGATTIKELEDQQRAIHDRRAQLAGEIAKAQADLDAANAAAAGKSSDDLGITGLKNLQRLQTAVEDLRNEDTGLAQATSFVTGRIQELTPAATTATGALDAHTRALIAAANAGDATALQLTQLRAAEASLTATSKDATKSAADRAAATTALATVQAALATATRDATGAAKAHEDALIALATAHHASGDQLAQLVRKEATYQAILDDETKSAEQQADALEHLKKIRAALGESAPVDKAAPGPTPEPGKPVSPGTDLQPTDDPNAERKLGRDRLAPITRVDPRDVKDSTEALTRGMQDAQAAVQGFGDTFARTFQQVLAANKTLGAAIASAGRGAIAAVAAAEAQFYYAKAAGYLAEGIGGKPSGFAAAAKATLAGAGFSALAAVLGGGGGSGGGGGAGSAGGGGALSPDRFTSDGTGAPQNTLTIVVQGGASHDSAMQDWLVDTLRNAQGRGVTVVVQ